MTEKQELDLKIRTYHNLNEQKKLMENRLSELNKQIKAALGKDTNYENATHKVTMVIKQSTPQLAEEAVLRLVTKDPGLWDLIKTEVIDPNLIEQLYLTGYLSDDDLRFIRKEPTITTALHVEKKFNV